MKDNDNRAVKVLICDDDSADRKILREILSRVRDREFEITEAGTKEDISTALSTNPPDLILLDLAMPEKSGKVWLAEIVEKEIAPVVIITGHGELEDSFEAMRFGALAYISKNWLADLDIAVPTMKRTVNYALDQWFLERDLESQMKEIIGETKILICDDDPADRKLVKSYLEKLKRLKLNIEEAGDFDEISRAIEHSKYDLILMDHSMPHRCGIEWAEEILRRKLAPVVMITSHGSEELAVEAMKLGVSDYISKEMLSANKLYKAISNVLR